MSKNEGVRLRDYQADLIDRGRQALRRIRQSTGRAPRVLLQAPTGAGKTVLASFMISETAARNLAAWFICHRAELVDGTSKTFTRFGVAHGIIAGGYPADLRQLVQVCSIDTLKNRLAVLTPPKLAIIDECHHCGAAGWALVVEWLTKSGCMVVGLSATPVRLDGQGLDAHFDDLVLGPPVSWLMEQGHLSRYKLFAPNAPDMKGARKSMGDWSRTDAAERMSKPKLTGDIIAHWRQHAGHLRTVGFACSIAHSQHMVEQFKLAGINAAHLDGGTPKADRKRIIADYASGRLQMLWNVDLFGEGFDLASIAQRDVTIDAVIKARPTQSLALSKQQDGRALRPKPHPAVILDHAGNIMRHGFPDDDVDWQLKGSAKGSKAANDNAPPPPVICEGCFNAIRRPLPPKCPHCEKPMLAQAKEIEVADGELVEMTEDDKRRIRAERLREQAQCKDMDSLVALFAKRGSKNPMFQAKKVMEARRGKSMRYG